MNRWALVATLLFLSLDSTWAAQHSAQLQATCGASDWVRHSAFELPKWALQTHLLTQLRESPLVANIVNAPLSQQLLSHLFDRFNRTTFWNTTNPTIAAIMKERFDEDTKLLQLDMQLQSPHILQNLNPQSWSIRNDPPLQSSVCYVVYMFAYVSSWVCLTIFIGLIQEGELNMSLSNGRVSILTNYFGWIAFLTNLIYACVTFVCTVRSDCGGESRKIFNFIWAGLILAVFGGMKAWKGQKANKKLEQFLIDRQQKIDRVFKNDPNYVVEAISSAHHKHMETLRNLQYLAEEANDHIEGGHDSIILKPIRDVPRSLAELVSARFGLLTAGVAWCVVVGILTTVACASTQVL